MSLDKFIFITGITEHITEHKCITKQTYLKSQAHYDQNVRLLRKNYQKLNLNYDLDFKVYVS